MLEDKLKLKEQEKLLLIIRPGCKFYISKLFIFSLLMLTPCFFYFFLITQGIHGYLLIAGLLILGLLYGIRGLIIYYYNVYIITNQRIIGIEQKGIFKKIIMAIEIEHIKNINFFKKKSLLLQLVDGANLTLKKIDDCEYAYEVINNLLESHRFSGKKISFVRREL